MRLPLGVGQVVLVGSYSCSGCVAPWKVAQVMTSFSDVRIFFCTTPTNMTYTSFDRLLGRAQEIF